MKTGKRQRTRLSCFGNEYKMAEHLTCFPRKKKTKYNVNQANHASIWLSAKVSQNSVSKINCSTSKTDFLAHIGNLSLRPFYTKSQTHIHRMFNERITSCWYMFFFVVVCMLFVLFVCLFVFKQKQTFENESVRCWHLL